MTNETEETTMTRKQAKVFQLCKELDEMKDLKKKTSKGYNDEIKRIQAEIDDLISPDADKEEEEF
jgi:hypothetical protein